MEFLDSWFVLGSSVRSGHSSLPFSHRFRLEPNPASCTLLYPITNPSTSALSLVLFVSKSNFILSSSLFSADIWYLPALYHSLFRLSVRVRTFAFLFFQAFVSSFSL